MEDPLGRSFITIICFAVCAFLTACRSAVKNANMSKLEEEAQQDKRLSSYIKLLEKPERTLPALELMHALLLVLAMFINVTGFMKTDRSCVSIIVYVLVFSLIYVICCRTVPERVGDSRADEWVMKLRGPVTVLTYAMLPFVLLMNGFTFGLARLFGVDLHIPEKVTEEDILTMVDSGEEAGTIESDEADLIENVFDFSDLTASDCMTHRTDVTAIRLDQTDEEILDIIRESGLSRFPVYDEDIDDVVGILSTRDFLFNIRESEPKPLKQLLRETYFVPETVAADTLFRDMQHRQTHIAIVVDEYGGMSGLITLEDLLEELVGNIYDEFDKKEAEPVVRLDDNTWRAEGTADTETLEEQLNIHLPESEDYDTLGGLVYSRFTAIPQDGSQPELDIVCTSDGEKPEEGEYKVMHIRVEKICDRRVESAILTLRTEKTEEEE